MKSLELNFYNLPPMPTNRAKALVIAKGRPMYIKTPLAREFEKDVLDRLKEFSASITEFVLNFDKKQHFVSAEYIFYTEYDVLFTKEGSVSNRAGDLDSHKLFQDTLFSFMGLDDKLIRDVRYLSYPSYDDKPNAKVTFKLESLTCLKNIASVIPNTTEQTNEILTSYALL
jgi:hypothetical protein